MPFLVITPLSQLAATAEKYQPRDMVTLTNAATTVTRPAMIPAGRHLSLYFNDISKQRKGLVAPSKDHVAALLQFVQSWERAAPLLIHCQMGISRSTAAAFIAACALNTALDEQLLAGRLREKAPSATPNARLVRLADRLLGRGGRMNAAIRQIGRGKTASEGAPFTLEFL